MRGKKIISITLSLMLSFSLMACNEISRGDEGTIKLDETSKKIVNGNNKFAFNMFNALSKEDKGENIFISPISISTALTMAYQGAEGNTKKEMEKVLGYEGIDINEINKNYKELMKYSSKIDKNVDIKLGNSIWIREGEKIKKEFIDVNKKYFDAEVNELDFNKSASADEINGWISKLTNGKIENMIAPPIPSDTIMYLINAIYFKGDWQESFDKKLSYEGDFKTSSGEMVKTNFMKKEFNKKTYYGEGEDFRVVELPYGDGKISMYVVLPSGNKTLEDLMDTMSTEKWQKIKASIGKDKESVNLAIPSFKFEYGTKELNSALANLGMKEAFSNKANFNGIREDVFISQVMHKATIEVNEKGSEATGATVIGIEKTSIQEPKEFIADRPFMFIIEDDISENISFIGSLNNFK